MAPKTFLLINGPNLNLLGYREPHVYGHTTLSDVEAMMHSHCELLSSPPPSADNSSPDTDNKITLLTYQSNSEGLIIDRIHAAFHSNLAALKPLSSPLSPKPSETIAAASKLEGENTKIDAIIINPGGLTHTSVALRDALVGASIPFIEVHISNVHAREEFRHKSFLSEKAVGVICGLGTYGYIAALEFVVKHLNK